MLVKHLAWRYICKRRIAWLAVITCMLSVAIPVIVIGILQGFVDISEKQLHGAESDLVASTSLAYALPHIPKHVDILKSHPGIKDASPYVKTYCVLTPIFTKEEQEFYEHTERDEARFNIGCQIEGVNWDGEQRIERLQNRLLHKRPGIDLRAPKLTVEERGSGFLTPSWRSYLALQSINCLPFAGPFPIEMPQPQQGVILGHELIFTHGLNTYRPGRLVKLTIPNGKGGLTGRIVAEISDTIGTGFLEFDKTMCVLPLPNAQKLADMDNNIREISGYRIKLHNSEEADLIREDLKNDMQYRLWYQRYGYLTWEETGSINMVKTFEIQRNLTGLVMLLIQMQCIFIVYAVFSTLVSEKKHDIGVLLGIGARRNDILLTFIFAAFLVSTIGGLMGWACGWFILAILNPVCDYFDIALFPHEVLYTPDTPISWEPIIPLFFLTVMIFIAVLSALWPAYKASRIMPLESIGD